MYKCIHTFRDLGWQMLRRGRWEKPMGENERNLKLQKCCSPPHTANSTCHCQAAALISRNKREILRFNKTELFYLWDLKLKTIAISGILNHNHWERFNWSLRKIIKDERLLQVMWSQLWERWTSWGWHWTANPVSVCCQVCHSQSNSKHQRYIKPTFSTILAGSKISDKDYLYKLFVYILLLATYEIWIMVCFHHKW